MNFEKKEDFIYSGRKQFCRKMDVHTIIGRESNSSFLPDSQIYLYYFLHLWPFNRTLPFGDVPEDSLAITSWISKMFLQLKGRHLKKLEGSWFPIGDFKHFRYQFFPFLTFLS